MEIFIEIKNILPKFQNMTQSVKIQIIILMILNEVGWHYITLTRVMYHLILS